jgi:hypothetical protein
MWKRAWVAFGLATAACKGESKDPAPGPTLHQQPRDEPSADAATPPAGRPPDIATVDVAVGAPLPRQPSGILVIDAAGRIAVADAPSSWDGALPAQTTPLPEPELEQLWLEDQREGIGTWLALESDKLTPATWRAAKQRRAKERAVSLVDSPLSRMVRATVSTRTGPDDDQGRSTPAIFASPTAPARLLAKVLVLRGGTVVVRTNTTTRALTGALAKYTRPSEPSAKPWIELHLDERGVHVLQIPGARPSEPQPFPSKLVAWAELDRASLKATLAEYAGSAGSPPEIDLVVGDGVPVQRFVDVVAHMQALGIVTFGVAERAAAPDSRHLQEIERDWMKRTIRQDDFKFTYCYERRLAERPGLTGTVTSSFRILPTVARRSSPRPAWTTTSPTASRSCSRAFASRPSNARAGSRCATPSRSSWPAANRRQRQQRTRQGARLSARAADEAGQAG